MVMGTLKSKKVSYCSSVGCYTHYLYSISIVYNNGASNTAQMHVT